MTNTKSQKDIADDAVVRRLYAQGKWKLKSAAHFGGDETGIADMCLLRDAKGNPFIPGASIAGAARSYLARKRMSWENYSHDDGIKKEPRILRRLFGGAEKANTVEDSDSMSALIVADATCVDEKANTSIRDGVRVVAETGTAAEGAKFDVEVLERDTEFLLNFECIVRKEDSNAELTKLFLALLHAFQKGDIQLGARTRRGYGRGKVDCWNIYDLQMNTPEDVLAWLNGNPSLRPKSRLVPRPLGSDQQNYFRIEADFRLRTSLLIRSSSEDPKDPDMVHLHSKDKPVIPGTSFAGAFRHRANLIAEILEWQTHENGQDAVCEMFGAVHKRDDDSDDSNQADPWASRVFIEERLVRNVKPQWQDRVAIDRFTGGSLQSALFNEKPVYPCPIKAETETNVQLRLTLEEPEKAEIGLLLLTLRDFWYGHAALGGETSNGRGTLCGIKAKLIYKNTLDPSDTKGWKLTHQGKCMTIESDDDDNDKFLQGCVDVAQNYKDRPKASRRPKGNVQEDSNAE